MKNNEQRFQYRKVRTRTKIAVNLERPRLSVHKTGKHLYAQIIDDNQGKTLVHASSVGKDLKGKLESTKNIEAAKKIGELVAKKAIAAGVKQVRFDRGGNVYHGRIKAIADAARAAGLEF